ncbi:MAG: Hsp70 family protein [Actinomycetota bacterium]|nr:Hsp70 family protein [Actinomycetota bacterium]
MSYWLGVDVGSTFTAAAICRMEAGRRAMPEVVPLGTRSNAVSSVVYLGQDGEVIVGEAAERRAVTHPDRVVREFKRRIGDEVPMVIGGAPHSAPEITAKVVRWVVDRVTQREGGPAAGIVITHPASWGAYKTRIIAEALRVADLPQVTFRTEPEAAAASYALQERIESGSTIAVYDLGGGTFDAAVVRKTGATTFSVLGHPQGLEQLGGVDFDDAVFNHVLAAVPDLAELDPDDPATLEATAALRRECTAAKEALSVDTEVTIPVLAPGIRSQVRLVRAEFEDMIRSQVAETVEALRQTLRSAAIEPQGLDAVLLVGGSSRVPLVAQLVSAGLGRPVAVDSDPKAAIALGAALSAVPAGAADSAPSNSADAGVPLVPPQRSAVGSTPEVPTTAPIVIPQRPVLTSTPLDIEVAEPRWRQLLGAQGGSRRGTLVAAAAILALVVAGGAVLVLTAGSGPAAPAQVGSPAVTSVAPPPPPNAGNGGDPAPPDGRAAPAPIAPHTTGAGLPAPRPIGSTGASVPTIPANPPSTAAIPTTTTSPPVTTTSEVPQTTAPVTTTAIPTSSAPGHKKH